MLKRFSILGSLVLILLSSFVLADVSMTDKAALKGKTKAKAVKPGRLRTEKAQSTGGVSLIDASGLRWFINTNITFATSSSASAAMSEASYTGPVQATTMGGGNVASTLGDAYDGYQSICVSFTGATGPCATGNPSYVFYNQTGAAPTLDASCANRQYIFPNFTTNGIRIQRRVYVPATDSFARWLNSFTNTTGAPITFNMITGNNLGSDSSTVIVTSSSGNAGAEVADTWVTTFQNYSGTTSSDPRLGHVFRGPGASIGLTNISFVNGNDNPFWTYTLTVAPGATAIIMNFAAAQPSKAAAAAKATQLAGLAIPAATACMSGTELSQVANFAATPVTVPMVGPVGLALIAFSLALVGFFLLRRMA